MIRRVPYLPAEQIEQEAAALLAHYGHVCGSPVTPPVSVEEIVQKHLRLGLEFDDLHGRFGVPRTSEDSDILGALYFDERRIAVDESLDPDEFPTKETRFRFTLAHEAGHWRLHRLLLAGDAQQTQLFDGPVAPSVVCRSSRAKEPIEWQADYFAAALLMPARLLAEAWRRAFGSDRPFVFDPDRHAGVANQRRLTGPRPLSVIVPRINEPDYVVCFNEIARPFASAFGVSTQAMRIRLEQLGLLLRQTARQHAFGAGE